MIPVTRRDPPPEADFDQHVRRPGLQWLVEHPTHTKGEKMPPYWQKCLPDLRRAYKGICSYYCCYVRPVSGTASVDHFVAKSGARDQAYEWSNYRFSCLRMNARKSDASDVIDPFTLVDGWFEIHFPTMQVRPGRSLTDKERSSVRQTINRLDLNSHECREERAMDWDDYSDHGLRAERFVERAPFIALEAARQGLLKPCDQHITRSSIRAWLDAP